MEIYRVSSDPIHLYSTVTGGGRNYFDRSLNEEAVLGGVGGSPFDMGRRLVSERPQNKKTAASLLCVLVGQLKLSMQNLVEYTLRKLVM
jgi:hypothetical protein